MTAKVIGVVATALLLAGCHLPGTSAGCNSQIDWVNFIQVGSTQYVAGPDSVNAVQGTDLGAVYAHVKFKVSGNVCDPNYRLKDGDAAFLDPGTPIYELNGHPASMELAVRFNGGIVAYRSTTS